MQIPGSVRLAQIALVWALTLFAGACFSSPSLNYEFHPRGHSWKCLQYDDYLMMRCSYEAPALEMDITFLKPDATNDIVKALLPRRKVSQRVPEFLPVRVHIRNWRGTAIHADFYRFRLRDGKSGRRQASMTPTPYYKEHYTDGLGILDFYWAFEQKDAYRFLQPLPPRLLAREPDTASPAERDRRRARRLAGVLAGHPARTLIPPARAGKGFLLFPRPAAGRAYTLEYGPPTAESGPSPGGEKLDFPPLRFRVQLTRSGDLAPAAEEKLQDKQVRRLFRRDRDQRRRDNRELFIMHRQLREHARLRAEKSGKMNARELRRLFGK